MNLKTILALVVFSLAIAVSPARAVFIGDNAGNLWDLDVSTNISTNLGNSGIGAFFDIAQDPTSGNLYGITGAGIFASIDTTNGSGTALGSVSSFINGLTFDSSGTLFGSGGGNLFTLDLGGGAASFIGNTGYTSSGDIAFDSSGNLYMTATGGDRLISVDSTTGSGSLIGDIGFSAVYGLNYVDSTLFGFTLSGATLSINTLTGSGTQVVSNGIAANGADGAGGVTAVPEPSIIALFSAGLLGIGFARRRKL